MTLSDLAKYSMTRSIARSLCDSRASCYVSDRDTRVWTTCCPRLLRSSVPEVGWLDHESYTLQLDHHATHLLNVLTVWCAHPVWPCLVKVDK